MTVVRLLDKVVSILESKIQSSSARSVFPVIVDTVPWDRHEGSRIEPCHG